MRTDREFQEASDRMNGEYGMRYAGRSRLTREIEPIRRLAGEAKALLEAARRQVPPPSRDVLGTLQERAELYATEADAVARARSQAGSSAVRAAELARRANLWFRVYARHFAGQPRASRDLERMSELVDGLRAVEREMAADAALNASNLEIVRERLGVYGEEIERIEEARRSVALEEQSGLLGGRANTLFAVWDQQFAGLPRLSRRPERLEALVRGLTEIREAMRRLPEPSDAERAEVQGQNLQVVERRLEIFESELAAIRQARETTAFEGLVDALVQERDAIMRSWDESFAGQSRRTRDLVKLHALCDRIEDVEVQVQRLSERFVSSELTAQTGLIRDLRDMLESEAEKIREAQEAQP